MQLGGGGATLGGAAQAAQLRRQRLRAGAAGRHGKAVPIVALTANAFVEDRSACLAAGMNDFLTKPVLAASLEATVIRWTAHARRHRAVPPSVFGTLHVAY